MTDRDPLYRRHRYPAEIIAHAVWLYFRFPLSLRMVEDMLAARGIIVSHRHALMTMIAYAFLQHQRLQTAKREKKKRQARKGPPEPTLPAIRRAVISALAIPMM